MDNNNRTPLGRQSSTTLISKTAFIKSKALGSDAGVRCCRRSVCCIHVGGVKSQPFTVGVGFRRGCVLSSLHSSYSTLYELDRAMVLKLCVATPWCAVLIFKCASYKSKLSAVLLNDQSGFFLRFRFGDRKEILRDRLEEFERPFPIDVISGHYIVRDRWRNLRDRFGPSKHLKKTLATCMLYLKRITLKGGGII